MNKNAFKTALIICLVLSNIMLVIFIVGKPADGRPDHDRPKRMVIEKLHFDEQQVADYQVLINEHRRQIRELDQQIIAFKKELYSHLSEENNKTISDSLTTEIAKVQQRIEQVHFAHFTDIKKLCRGNQQADFEALSQELTKIFPPRRK
jgi:protein CpxP